MSFLAHIDSAKREILAADSLLKVKDLWNKADAMRALGQAAKDPELINHATEFKLRCERRLGELLSEAVAHGGDPKTRQSRGVSNLADLEISKDLSSRSQRLASVPEDRFESVLAQAKEEEKEITRRAIDKLLLPNTNRVTPSPLPIQKYRTIVIDPPWPMEKILRDVRPNQVTFDYPTMSREDLLALPIEGLAESSGCHVYCWFTQKWRHEADLLFDAWGVKAECFLTWVKNVGFTPYSWMYSTEHVLFGRYGTLPLLRLGKRLDFAAKVREHSRKPDEFYDLVCEVSPTPRLDMFSREPHEGFDQWGNEVGKFENVPAR